MSTNSSPSNDSLLQPLLPPIGSFIYCIITRPGSFIFTTYVITYILLLLPLCIFILHHGLQQRRQKKRSTSSAATVSHSDILTYHMVVMELIGIFGCVLLLLAIYIEDFNPASASCMFLYFTWYGETFFHILTCVERYLAVVHPITYLSLRNQRGTRIRNISIACVWLLCLVLIAVILMISFSIFVDLCFSIFSLTAISFCSLCVLCVLIRPGPGEQGGDRARVDQSKLRAFYTIVAILVVLVLRVHGTLIWHVLHLLGSGRYCVVAACSPWLSLPSSLVLPLLFLHRAGKLVCCEKNI